MKKAQKQAGPGKTLTARRIEELAAMMAEDRKVLMAILRRLEAVQSERRRLVPDLKVAEAARLLSLAPATVYKLIASGEIVAMNIGRCTRIREEDLNDFRLRMRVVKGDGLSGEA